MSLTSSIIDNDDVAAEYLWDSLEKNYITLNEQSIISFLQELERLEYQEGTAWEEHLNKFHEIKKNLAALDK